MSDGYDLFCALKLLERPAAATTNMDDVTCACANYLQSESHHHSAASRALAAAATLIPTTANTVA